MLMWGLGWMHRLPARHCRGSQRCRAERSKAPRGAIKQRITWNRLMVRKTEEKQKEALAAAEGKEWRLGDITVSSPRPVLHCSYRGERETEEGKESERERGKRGRETERARQGWGE